MVGQKVEGVGEGVLREDHVGVVWGGRGEGRGGEGMGWGGVSHGRCSGAGLSALELVRGIFYMTGYT